jgi:hypothetical protein
MYKIKRDGEKKNITFIVIVIVGGCAHMWISYRLGQGGGESNQ